MNTTVLRFVGGPASGKTTALRAFADERSAAGVKCLLASGRSSLQGILQETKRGGFKAVLIDEEHGGDIEGLVQGLLNVGLDHIVVATSQHPAERERDAALAQVEQTRLHHETAISTLRAVIDQRDALLANLTEAAATLRRYETLHRAKNTDESTVKAEVNAELATRFEATIAKVQGDHAWKTGPADHGATNLLPVVEALLAKAYKQNWNDQYPELLEQAEAAVAAAKAGAQ